MAFHVMESKIFRNTYGPSEMRDIFEEKSVIESWLLYEGILAESQGELGIIPKKFADEIRQKATLNHVSFERIVEIFQKTKLASVATIRALAEVCGGGAGEYVHYGSCSPELFENTLMYRIRKAMEVLETQLKELRSLLKGLVEKHRNTLMVERSHGQQGLPTSFGLVCAIWSEAVRNHLARFRESKQRVLSGSLKGPYANYASYYTIAGEKCLELEKRVLTKLGLEVSRISVTRHIERFAEFMNLLLLLAMTFEKISDDIFTMQRNEIAEVEEPFDTAHQIGSSTLPHKRNPIFCEAIQALGKKIRSNAAAFADTHMRESHDLTGFYLEDLIIPETCLMTGSMLENAKTILTGLIVKKEKMVRNLELFRGLIMDEALMFALSKKTGKKQTTYNVLHKAAMEAFERGISFGELISEDPFVRESLTKEEVLRLLQPESYLGLNDFIIEGFLGDKDKE